MDNSFLINTRFGNFKCVYTKRGIFRIYFPGEKRADPDKFHKPVTCPFDAQKFKKDLASYLSGKKISFNVPLDLTGATNFQNKVWRAIAAIPYGECVTYKGLCKVAAVKNSFRAAGNACGRNPVPVIIPCHRVIGSNGKLGGFSSGIKWKKLLLALEKQ